MRSGCAQDLRLIQDTTSASGGVGVGGSAREAGGVEPGRWGEHRPPVGDGDGPLAVVDQVMVVPAEQHQVLQAGFTTIGPVLDVVGVALTGVATVAGDGADAGAGGHRSSA